MRLALSIAVLLNSLLVLGQHWKEVAIEGKKNLDDAEYENAIQLFDSAKHMNGDAGLLDYNSGVAYYRLAGDDPALYDSAQSRFKNSLDYLSDNKRMASAYHNIGNVHMVKQEFADAVEAYKQALRRDPKNEKTRQNLITAMRNLPKDQNDQNGGGSSQQDKKEQQEKQDQQDKGDQGDKQNDPQDKGQQDQNDQKGDPQDKQDGQQGDKQENNSGDGSPEKQEKEGMSEQQIEQLLRDQKKEEAATRKAMMQKGKLDKEGKPVKGGASGKDW